MMTRPDGRFIVRNAGAACGIDLLETLFRVLDPDVRVQQ
jgi:nicotinate-nucleotide pyrophosphorylase